MPPLPKKKTPQSRQGKRRSHLRAEIPATVTCTNCRAPRLAHRACPTCGYYRGRRTLDVGAEGGEG